ncbi:antitermination protein [Sodalis ligni]|uniref:antiterminator Q family protein n=1 Tax=Sodalis ligni TaxID=2697027 RepID=UPI001BDF0485|nr:antitermination protein [Sodalis ligni]
MAAGFKGLIPFHRSQNQCCDEDGLIVEGCVGCITTYSPSDYEFLIMHCVYAILLISIARKWWCYEGTIRKKLQSSEGFIFGYLSALNAEIEMDV